METASLPETTDGLLPTQPEPPETAAAATRSNSKLFEWSGFVHVGDGANECPQREEGVCDDPDHFHAWVCLPNPLQIRDIGDKARAAKARKIRALKDSGDGEREESDSYITLEASIEEAIETELPMVIGEIVEERAAKALGTVYQQLKEEERFEGYDQDIEELRRQEILPEDQRDADYPQLVLTADRFEEALNQRLEEFRKDGRQSLEGLSAEEIAALLRAKRIQEIAGETFLNAYYTWQIFVGTRKVYQHNARVFTNIGEYKMAAPEIIDALRDKIAELENRTTGRDGGSGNS
jgi:hypothetical protein